MIGFLILLVLLSGCAAEESPWLNPSDYGRPLSGGSLTTVAIVAMPSPRLDKPLEGDLVPTVYLARVAADYLKEHRKVVAVDATRSTSGTNAPWGAADMAEHLSQQRLWWNANTGQTDYSELKDQGVEGVLEIGIANYEIAFGKLLLQVFVKLVDPATGTVLGKARAGANEKVDPLTVEQFKLTFAQTGRTLVVDNLARMGL